MLKLFISFLFCFSSLSALESSSHQATITSTEGNWDKYYQNTINETQPRPTLSYAQQYFEMEERSGLAVDLGTGTGRDALFLLKKGWNVLAIDAEALSIDILLNRVQDKQLNPPEVMISPFSNMMLPDNIDLINASFSLPFCNPEDFPECWQKIIDHLAIGGRFAGQLFGDKDEWAADSSMTFFNQEQMLQLFEANFSIEYLQIEEGLIPKADGKMKYWHIYHVVAKKIR